jgi:hypothetical protein
LKAILLCSIGWHEDAWITILVVVGFLYILNSNFSSVLNIETSKKFNLLLFSCSNVNWRFFVNFIKFFYDILYVCFSFIIHYEYIIYISVVVFYIKFLFLLNANMFLGLSGCRMGLSYIVTNFAYRVVSRIYRRGSGDPLYLAWRRYQYQNLGYA